MPSLLLRIISAAVALVLLIGVYQWKGAFGVTGLALVICILAVYEFNRLAFKPLGTPLGLRVLFFLVCSVLVLLSSLYQKDSLLVYWAVMTSGFYSVALWSVRNRLANDAIYKFFTASALGFLYCAVLPAVCVRLMLLPEGMAWLLILLSVVFSGDVFAYFGGIWFGKKKLMPSVSPGKTIAGSVAGTGGSVIGGYVASYLALGPEVAAPMALVAIAGAFFAQSGDLFISLIKRVAQMKDSGKIMPGHGGVLDRLDGVFFAAPVILAAAIWLQ